MTVGEGANGVLVIEAGIVYTILAIVISPSCRRSIRVIPRFTPAHLRLRPSLYMLYFVFGKVRDHLR